MSELAGNLQRKFIGFRRLGVESSAHKIARRTVVRETQNVAGSKEAKTSEIGETSTSPAKGSSKLQDAAVKAGCIGAKLGDEDRDLTTAENDCVMTSSDENVEDLSAFVTERLQCLSEGGVEELIGDSSVNVEKISRIFAFR